MVDGISARRLTASAARSARGRETPFYLFDPAVARTNLRRLREAAGRGAGLFYPWKCNRYAGLLDLADEEEYGAEVTAGEDLVAAVARWGGRGREQGSRVLYQGPAKSERSLDVALSSGVWLVADSEEDAEAILARARCLGVAPRYLLRFRPLAVKPSQRGFGLAPGRVLSLCARLAREGRPLAAGLAFHLGTGLLSAAPFASAVHEAGRLAERLGRLGVPVEILDVGGGLPARGELRRVGRGRLPERAGRAEALLRAIRKAMRREAPLRGARLFVEPGRAVASDAFQLVTRVVRVAGRRVYVDASRVSHAFFIPSGQHRFLPVPRRPGSGTVAIGGPLPIYLDRFAARETIGRPREGDLLLIGSVGAYNLMMSNSWAGSLPEVVAIGVSAWRRGRRSGERTRR